MKYGELSAKESNVDRMEAKMAAARYDNLKKMYTAYRYLAVNFLFLICDKLFLRTLFKLVSNATMPVNQSLNFDDLLKETENPTSKLQVAQSSLFIPT